MITKILIVDDDKEILKSMEKKFSSKGYGVVTAKQGKEAVEKAKREIPNLILMDIVLPDIEGSEAVRLIKENPSLKKIPVIFISGVLLKENDGSSATEIKVAGQQYRAFCKPFNFEALFQEVEKELSYF